MQIQWIKNYTMTLYSQKYISNLHKFLNKKFEVLFKMIFSSLKKICTKIRTPETNSDFLFYFFVVRERGQQLETKKDSRKQIQGVTPLIIPLFSGLVHTSKDNTMNTTTRAFKDKLVPIQPEEPTMVVKLMILLKLIKPCKLDL